MVVYEKHGKIPLNKFYDELAFEFPNLPSQLFEYYILRTAIDMATKGNIIRRLIVIQPEPCVTNYRLVSPDGMKVSAILGIRHHTCCFDAEMPRAFVPPVDSVCCSQRAAWYDDAQGELHIADHGCHGTYFVNAAVTPSRDDCELPEEYMDKFLETLMMGTKASIMLITGRPWTNLRIGAASRQEYQNMLAADSVDVAAHGMRGAIRAKFPRAL